MRIGWILPLLVLVPHATAAQTFVRLNVDNDAFVVTKLHDRDYTHGLELTVGSRQCAGESCRARSVGLAHALFTPNIKAPAPPPLDRPYAGYVGVRGVLENWDRASAWRVDGTLGLRGPAALGNSVQTLVHEVLGFARPVGWDDQLPTSPWVEARGVVAKWTNIDHLRLGAWGGAELGTMRGGARFALRSSLGTDGRWLQPVAAKGLAYGIGLEGGVAWRAWDATLEGFDAIGAIPNQQASQFWVLLDQTLQWKEWAVTWAMAWQTREFDGQPTGPTVGTLRFRFAPRGAGQGTQPAAWPAPSGQ